LLFRFAGFSARVDLGAMRLETVGEWGKWGGESDKSTAIFETKAGLGAL
jgi:hypothetical protein